MEDQTFNNRLRIGGVHVELAKSSFPGDGISGAKFEKAILDEEVGAEVVLLLLDSTPFAHKLIREHFELRLKLGVAETSAGPILFLLWWIPPLVNGTPFALYEQLLNPTHPEVLELLRETVRQTHLHLVLIGPGPELLDVYEFENAFGLEKAIPVSEKACEAYRGRMDFVAAKLEYSGTYDLMELFSMKENGEDGNSQAT